MFREFFQLTDHPFSLEPDVKFNYFSHQQHKALTHCIRCFERNQLLAMIAGDEGVGKSIFSLMLKERLSDCYQIISFDASLVKKKLLLTLILEASGKRPSGDSVDQQFKKVSHLIHQAYFKEKKVIFIIDNAEQLTKTAFEQLCLLFADVHGKMNPDDNPLYFHLALLGRTSLIETLYQSSLNHLVKAKSQRYVFMPLSKKGGMEYIQHRLTKAGCVNKVFDDDAAALVVKVGEGIPSRINNICEKAFTLAYQSVQHVIDFSIVESACLELGWMSEKEVHTHSQKKGLAQPNQSEIVPSHLNEKKTQEQQGVACRENPKRKAFIELLFSPRFAVFSGLYLLLMLVSSVIIFEPGGLSSIHSSLNAVVEKHLSPETGKELPILMSGAIDDTTAAKPKVQSKYFENPSVVQSTVPSKQINTNKNGEVSAYFLDEEKALVNLKKWWGDQTDREFDCSNWLRNKLNCMVEFSDLTTLALLNLPVGLVLTDHEGRRGFGILYAVNNKNVKLLLDGRRAVIPLNLLTQLWKGEVRFLWFTPDFDVSELAKKTDSKAKVWLNQKLDEYFTRKLGRENPQTLVDKLKTFQFDSGLTVTGKANALTLLSLSAASRPNRPELLQGVEDTTWEDWLLTQKGLIEPFDIITNMKEVKQITSPVSSPTKKYPNEKKQSKVTASKKNSNKKSRSSNKTAVAKAKKTRSDEFQPKKTQKMSKKAKKVSSKQKKQVKTSSSKPNKVVKKGKGKVVKTNKKAAKKTQSSANHKIAKKSVTKKEKKSTFTVTKTKTLSDSNARNIKLATSIPSDKKNTAVLVSSVPEVPNFGMTEIENTQAYLADNHTGELDKKKVDNGTIVSLQQRGFPSLHDIQMDKIPPALAQRVKAALKAKIKREKRAGTYVQGVQDKPISIDTLTRRELAQLPVMNFQAHVYAADLSRRWVKVNDAMLREGDELGEHVMISSIEPERVVLKFKNQFISVPALWSY